MVSRTKPHYKRYRFSVEDFTKAIDAGLFGEDDRIELVEGELVEMTPPGDLHNYSVNRFNRLFHTLLPQTTYVIVQNALDLSPSSRPQPDVMLIREPASGWELAAPSPDAVLLVVEVSDSSYRYDRYVKLPLYARAALPELWIVNLPQRQVEIYRQPVGDAYEATLVAKPGDRVSPLAFPDVAIAVDDILPPAGLRRG
ncbi:MAG: Uma2 family endonuclease [Dehalococcoidia bacterium]